jgi:ATP-dependent DNA helicase RecG
MRTPPPETGALAGGPRLPPEKLRIFVSSVEKELQLERAAVAQLVSTDPFLQQHCLPVLFEQEPPPPHPAQRPYLDALRGCAIYVLLLANEYGVPDGELSATHHEYRLAQQLKLPTVVLLKGRADDTRSAAMTAFIAEIKANGHTYKRFYDREDLKPEVLRALLRTLKEDFGITATSSDVTESERLIEAASAFEAAELPDVPVAALDRDLLLRFGREVAGTDVEDAWRPETEALASRGLVVHDKRADAYHATAAAWLLFAPAPANRIPQAEILADAYDDVRASGKPKGQTTINAPLPRALDAVLQFIDDHTFHPRRVVGLNAIRLDEYPTAALREALVNAVAHRSYDDRSRKVFVRVFSNRVEVSSPGYPPQPLTLAKLRRGGYRPCSRNPLIAQTLATLGLMEQRGSGFARMRDAMLNHGLATMDIAQQDGFFVVTLPGPAGDFNRIKTPAVVAGPVTPAIEAQLNERQRKALAEIVAAGSVSSGWLVKHLHVAYDTANRDLLDLASLGVLVRTGKGRASKYVLAGSGRST